MGLVICVTLFLSGCVMPYSPPVQGPLAKIGMLNQNIFSNQNEIAIFDDPIECKRRHALGNLAQRWKGEPTPIPANKLVTLDIYHLAGIYDPQDFPISFFPEENATYYVSTTNTPKNSMRLTTSMQILKTVKNSDGTVSYIPVTFIKRKLQIEPFLGGTQCVDEDVQVLLRKKLMES